MEGANYSDIRGRDELTCLWRELATRCGFGGSLEVYGISKHNIIALDESQGLELVATVPLDVLISQRQQQSGFRRAVIAFDRNPPNQYLPNGGRCEEVDFVLRRFAERARLPQQMISDAIALRHHYSMRPANPREIGHPPHLSLEILFMDPAFEAVLAADEASVVDALRPPRRVAWPAFNRETREPGYHIIAPAVEVADRSVRARVRGSFKTNKHGWALQIIRNARPKMLNHPIPERLRKLLAL